MVDELTIYQFDNAVTWLGVTVENLLSERVDVGSGNDKHSEAKYELEDLLDPDFRVPRETPKPKKPAMSGIGALMALAAQSGSGVKLWAPVKPS